MAIVGGIIAGGLSSVGSTIAAVGAGAAGVSAAAFGGGVATAATAAAVGFGATAASLVGTAAVGLTAFNALKPVKAAMPQLQAPPQVPRYDIVESAEKQGMIRAAGKKTKTVLTNPLGTTDGVTQQKALVSKLGY